jgi:hypothetical protein
MGLFAKGDLSAVTGCDRGGQGEEVVPTCGETISG